MKTNTFKAEVGYSESGRFINAIIEWNCDGEEGTEFVTGEAAMESFCRELERMGCTEIDY